MRRINRMTLAVLIVSVITLYGCRELVHDSQSLLIPKFKRSEIFGAGGEYVAEGDWNLLGTYPEKDRARHLLGVRARLVAGACNHPNCLVLRFSVELIRLAA